MEFGINGRDPWFNTFAISDWPNPKPQVSMRSLNSIQIYHFQFPLMFLCLFQHFKHFLYLKVDNDFLFHYYSKQHWSMKILNIYFEGNDIRVCKTKWKWNSIVLTNLYSAVKVNKELHVNIGSRAWCKCLWVPLWGMVSLVAIEFVLCNKCLWSCLSLFQFMNSLILPKMI